MSTAMVQAILAGRKTQTRRIAKNIPDDSIKVWYDVDMEWVCLNDERETLYSDRVKPKATKGDIIWVRECFAPVGHPELPYRYRADHRNPTSVRWTPSIHMPKAAARIWLRCTGVKTELLHDISEEDAIAEGVFFTKTDKGVRLYRDYIDKHYFTTAIESFNSLWRSINGDESFYANPWVWVYEFEVLSTTGMPESSIINQHSSIKR